MNNWLLYLLLFPLYSGIIIAAIWGRRRRQAEDIELAGRFNIRLYALKTNRWDEAIDVEQVSLLSAKYIATAKCSVCNRKGIAAASVDTITGYEVKVYCSSCRTFKVM